MLVKQKHGWISSYFVPGFFDNFIPKVKSYLRERGLQNAILLLDNAPSHPSITELQTQDGSIKCVFLPANTTSICQPMDQGVLVNLKRRYKRALLEKLLAHAWNKLLGIPSINTERNVEVNESLVQMGSQLSLSNEDVEQ